MGIAKAMEDSEALHAIEQLLEDSEAAPLVPQTWLDNLASSQAIRRIAGEIPQRPCQLLIDWVDVVGHREHCRFRMSDASNFL